MEARLFAEGTVPDYTTPEWYADRDAAPHLEQEPHRSRLILTESHIRQAVKDYGVQSVVDLGSGDGGLLSLIRDIPSWGYDLQQTNVEASKARSVDVRYGDIVHGILQWGDLAVTTELLEHLIDPGAMVRRVAEHSKVIVASSPWAETPESHYAFHAWCFDRDGYKEMIERNGFDVVQQSSVDIFQVVTGVKR